jgi:hypothetical protein
MSLGCTEGKPYNTARVSGRVTLDGTPLARAWITFQPERGPNAGMLAGPEAHADTDADGRFSLTTVFKDTGATIGRNRVTITTLRFERPPNDDGRDRPAKKIADERVPKKYFTAKSWLYFDVPARGTTEANFELTSN